MWAELMSVEIHVIRSAELVSPGDGNISRAVKARTGRAPRCSRTQARMYDRDWDLGDLHAARLGEIPAEGR